MALTAMPDFVFKHVNQADQVSGDPATFKTNMDSQAKAIRDFMIGTLKTELDSVTGGPATYGDSKHIHRTINQNLLFNPTFALGKAGWYGIGSNGFDIYGGGGVHLGNATSPTSTVQVDNRDNMYPVGAGVILTLSAEMDAAGVTAGAIGVRWDAYDSSKVLISGGSIAATNGTGYTKYSLTFTTPANTAYIQIACYIEANTTNTNASWRRLKLEFGSIATMYSDDYTLSTKQYGGVLPLSQVLSGGNKKQTGSGAVTIATAGTRVNLVVTFPVAFATTPTVTIGVTSVGTDDAGYINVRAAVVSSTSVTFSVNCYLAQTINFNWEATGT